MTLSEAHKTGKRYRRSCGMGEWKRFEDDWNLRMSSAIADDWEVEPQVHEVECRINDIEGFDQMVGFKSGYVFFDILSGYSSILRKKLKGKRTKLTIEVLD